MKRKDFEGMKPGTVLQGRIGNDRRELKFVFGKVHPYHDVVVGKAALFGNDHHDVVVPFHLVKLPLKN